MKIFVFSWAFDYKEGQDTKKLKAFKFYIEDIVDDTYICCIDSEEGDNEEFFEFIEALEKV